MLLQEIFCVIPHFNVKSLKRLSLCHFEAFSVYVEKCEETESLDYHYHVVKEVTYEVSFTPDQNEQHIPCKSCGIAQLKEEDYAQ